MCSESDTKVGGDVEKIQISNIVEIKKTNLLPK